MKSLTEHLWFNTKNKIEFINITDKIEQLVKKSGVKEGLVLVNAMHITASAYINDAESGLYSKQIIIERLFAFRNHENPKIFRTPKMHGIFACKQRQCLCLKICCLCYNK